MHLIIDRIEENTAICQTTNQGILSLPIGLLPKGTKEGDAVNLLDGLIHFDANLTAARSKYIKKLMEDLFI